MDSAWLSALLTAVSVSVGVGSDITARQQFAEPASRILLATVVDPRNRPVFDVGVDSFVISEGGQSREVLDVHVADYPVVVLVDDGPQPTAGFEALRTAVKRFVGRIGARPVAVGTLSNARLVATFEDERLDVLTQIDQLATAESAAAQSAFDALANAANLVRETGAPFSAIVMVTSRAFDAEGSVDTSFLPRVLETGATIHVVATRPPSTGTVSHDSSDVLRGLASQTHGQYAAIFSAASYAIALDKLADRMSTELMIEYLVPPGRPAGDIKVGARVPGARVVGLGVSRQ